MTHYCMHATTAVIHRSHEAGQSARGSGETARSLLARWNTGHEHDNSCTQPAHSTLHAPARPLASHRQETTHPLPYHRPLSDVTSLAFSGRKRQQTLTLHVDSLCALLRDDFTESLPSPTLATDGDISC